MPTSSGYKSAAAGASRAGALDRVRDGQQVREAGQKAMREALENSPAPKNAGSPRAAGSRSPSPNKGRG